MTITQEAPLRWKLVLTTNEAAVEALVRANGWQTLDQAIQGWLDAQAGLLAQADIKEMVPLIKAATVAARTQAKEILTP